MSNNESKFTFLGLTYDDVLLIPAYSEVLPRDVNIRSFLTKDIKINIPILSAAMDTVTESSMAIAMAQQGGIGIIHKNMSIDEQSEQIRLVKRSESGMILDPITLHEDATIKQALKIMSENKIGGIPIVNHSNQLIGIITNRDLRFESNLKLKIKDVMTSERLITASIDTDLKQAEGILQKSKIEKLPLVNDNNELCGLITFKDIQKYKSNPNACKDSHGRLRVGAAVGTDVNSAKRIKALVDANVDVIVIDTAHGHSKLVLEQIKSIRKQYPNLQIIAGNVATPEGTEALIQAGVDAVKVGIGPGSICTTRIISGVGMPQLSAVYRCGQVAGKYKIPIIADGGINQTGDIAKAIAAGASSVMIGSLFAGVEESPGETIIYEGRKFKAYRGMGSSEAMSSGSRDRYFQDNEKDISKLVPEGIVSRVPYNGSLVEVLHQCVGGLRASMGYCGAETISKLQQAKFVQITMAGIRESHPHSVIITKEAPNYFSR
ncbi:MAG: IMP dehydrogenase [Solitalea-like symbiont of Tyrophagus putrescentiae]